MTRIDMTQPTAHKLYVNLSASQTRKRLKGHGFGVRRVEAADRNQSVVFHTATGQHLQELKSLFSDVITATSLDGLDTPVENLRNLGPASAAWLHEIGVDSESDLQRMGSVVAFRLVRQRQPHVNLNLLWALEAALTNRDWRELSTAEKQRLRDEVEED